MSTSLKEPIPTESINFKDKINNNLINIKSLLCGCCENNKIIPENTRILHCGLCFEEGAKKRRCCNCVFCDHCYTKNKACPNCKQSTRQEKMTGATYTVISYSDHEECRTCLEPGLKRRCCGNYYCDTCFYKSPTCKSCDAPITNLGLGLKTLMLGRASLVSVTLGWLMAILVILCVFAFVSILSTSETLTPLGMFGYKCYGFFRTCDKFVCITMQEQVANGTTSFPLLNTWEYCDLNSKIKMETSACVYDPQLYILTDSHAGYDICIDKFRNGLYIMEDNFENWKNLDFQSNQMKSALWNNIVNGIASNRCGLGVEGKNALTFNGADSRFAETKDMDVSSGGWLEADLFLSPQGFDLTHEQCKTAYSNGISIEYSINHGDNYINLQNYDAWKYRNEKFFHIQLELPDHAKTNSTRFRFIQPFFDLTRDSWALDNVKVFRYLPNEWYESYLFHHILKESRKIIEKWQCCFDTEWCTQRLSISEQQQCNNIKWYNGKIFILRGAELYVLICVILNVIKFIYICLVDWFIRKRIPFQEEIEIIAKIDYLMKYLPARYRPKKNIENYVNDIHKSARLAEEAREMIEDNIEEGETVDDIKKRKEVLEQERKEKIKALKKERKRIKERMKKRGYQGPGLESLEKIESDEEEEIEDNFKNLKFITNEKIATDEDKMKRGNIALLRIPFNTKNSWSFRKQFAFIAILLFVIIFLWRVSTTSYYILFQNITLFGKYPGHVELTSFGINFFAFLCDLKELYYVLKFIVPIKDDLIPQITVDLSTDVSALFIGTYTIPLSDIKEHNNFSINFIRGCTLCYLIGTFPFCMFSLLLRNQFLPFSLMRMISPIFGGFICFRAILGPAILLKGIFCMFYFFDFTVGTREKIGRAIQSERATLSARTTMFSVALFLSFVGSAFFFKFAGILFGIGIIIGYIYGLCTGCMHDLPIRPWMYITTIEPGIWLRVAKKQRCPCVYWGAFCTEIHNYEEILVIYPTDEAKFRFVVTGNVETEEI